MDKKKKLKKLQEECQNFFEDIYKDDKKIMVFGEGNPDARIVLVGEAPGEQETLQGRPFVGQAGKNLDEFLGVLGLKREDIYITNVVKFRPFKTNPQTGRKSNRPPSGEEVGLSQGWLFKELEIVGPSVVVSLGNVALKALYQDKKVTIGEVHGEPLEFQVGDGALSLVLFPLYHPASIIYRRELKETYLKDLDKLKEYLGI